MIVGDSFLLLLILQWMGFMPELLHLKSSYLILNVYRFGDAFT